MRGLADEQDVTVVPRSIVDDAGHQWPRLFWSEVDVEATPSRPCRASYEQWKRRPTEDDPDERPWLEIVVRTPAPSLTVGGLRLELRTCALRCENAAPRSGVISLRFSGSRAPRSDRCLSAERPRAGVWMNGGPRRVGAVAPLGRRACRHGYEAERVRGCSEGRAVPRIGPAPLIERPREEAGCCLLSDLAAARGHTFALEHLFLTVRQLVRGCERVAARLRLRGHRDSLGVIAVRPMITAETMAELEARGPPYILDVRDCGTARPSRAACRWWRRRPARRSSTRRRRRGAPGGAMSTIVRRRPRTPPTGLRPLRARAATRQDRQCARLPRPVPPLPRGDPQRPSTRLTACCPTSNCGPGSRHATRPSTCFRRGGVRPGCDNPLILLLPRIGAEEGPRRPHRITGVSRLKIIADLDSLTEVEQHGKRFIFRSAPRPAASLVIRATGVAFAAKCGLGRLIALPANVGSRRGCLVNRTAKDGSNAVPQAIAPLLGAADDWPHRDRCRELRNVRSSPLVNRGFRTRNVVIRSTGLRRPCQSADVQGPAAGN